VTVVLVTVVAATGPVDPKPAAATATAANVYQPRLLPSPFGAADAATFRFPGPPGTEIPAGDFPAAVGEEPAGNVRDDGGPPDATPQNTTPQDDAPQDDAPQDDTPQDDAPPDRAALPAAPAEVATAPDGAFLDLRPKSPAELLNLDGTARARHERCLANAVYFEARGEPLLGQMAVAQVVINRVFSGHYPGNVCGVVYQSTRRYHRRRCQFSFTCDGIPDRVTEPDAFERATRVARNALDGRFWVDDVGKATHYHARWVHPRWVHEMRRLDRIGVHTFYRPRRWGSGAAAPAWGDAQDL